MPVRRLTKPTQVQQTSAIAVEDRTFYNSTVQMEWVVHSGALAALALAYSPMAETVSADPATDGLARFNELSRQSEQTTEAMPSVEMNMGANLAVQRVAEPQARRRAALDRPRQS